MGLNKSIVRFLNICLVFIVLWVNKTFGTNNF